MSQHPIDDPLIVHNLFYVRKTIPDTHESDRVVDGVIPVAPSAELGYRFYRRIERKSPVLLLFHGNGEIASDYDEFALFYDLAGVSLLVVDYRGYGWSTGVPLTSQLLPDAVAVMNALPQILQSHDVPTDVPLFVMGRSLGSACAIYLAYEQSDRFCGLIVESGFADAPSLFRRFNIELPDAVLNDRLLPLNNVGKMRNVHCPLLVIHGANDAIFPVIHGQDLYDACPTDEKRLQVIAGAGHNNLIAANMSGYFGAIKEFVQSYS